MTDRNPRSYTSANVGGKPSAASESTESREGRSQQHLSGEGGTRQAGSLRKGGRRE